MEAMIRKQTYISSRQNKMIKKKAMTEGTTEAEIIRRAIDNYLENEMLDEDPLLGIIAITDKEPFDGSSKHDRYIYICAPRRRMQKNESM